MKKIYERPMTSVIELYSEDSVLAQSGYKIDSSQKADVQFSQKRQTIWSGMDDGEE